MDRVEIVLGIVSGVFIFVWTALEIRHSDRYGNNRSPMPPRTRSVLMWIVAILVAITTFWQTQHGKIFYP
jgi:uncharacterized membrane protein